MNSAVPLSPLKQAFLKIEELEARLRGADARSREPIAVVGIGCRLPGGIDSPESFWRLLVNGIDATRDVPQDRWDVERFFDPDPDAPGKTYARRGGYLDGVDQFDAPFFKISPREASVMDPQQRLLLEVAWEALEHAGIPPRSLENSRTGAFIALSTNDYWTLQLQNTDRSKIGPHHGSGIAASVASGRLAYVLGLQGPAITLDTACSGSLVAVHLACHSLRSGESKVALAGGVNLILSPENSIIFAKSRMLAADGRCKTFDAAADGFGEGEGCGIVVLKRLSDAVAEGDSILAVIRGSAINQDGPSSGLTAPNGPSQEAVIREALSNAGLPPEAVGYVEAHGTGTSLGDPIEVQALGAVLGQRTDPLWIGSVKTNLGHLEAAAGIAGLIKVILTLQHGVIPPHLHLRTPNPLIPWDDLAVRVPTTAVEWPHGNGPRVAGVSSFGFSGTNAHVIIGEPPSPPARIEPLSRPSHLLAFSAASPKALQDLAARYVDAERDPFGAPLADVCATANGGRSHEAHRAVVIGATPDDFRRRLAALGERRQADGVIGGVVSPGERVKTAFLFTGQGAQYAGMGRDLYQTHPIVRAALDRCADILEGHLDRPLLSVLFGSDGTGDLISQTAYTQPALFALEYALAELWQSWGIRPFAVLGHSLGEYVAATVAGVWRVEQALPLVARRARLMQALPPIGAMAAVFADERSVRNAIDKYSRVAIAAVNGPETVVISGEAVEVQSALAAFATAGVGSQRLGVSHAFHSPLMEPILDEFETAIGHVAANAPNVPIASNVSGALEREGSFDARYWRRHLREPVRFADGLRALRAAGIKVFVEIGPQPTLTKLGRRVLDQDAGVIWASSLVKDRDCWTTLLQSMAQLYACGCDPDWRSFDRPFSRARVALPTYPFQRQRHWFEHTRDTGMSALPARRVSHPLLGQRLSSAVGLFENVLSTATVPWLADHRVQGRIVFPAAAYLETARAAASEVLGHGVVIEDMTITESMSIANDEQRTMQVVVVPAGTSEASVQIFTRAADEETGWRPHATARARTTAEQPRREPISSEMDSRCAEPRTAEAHYADVTARGIELGPSFQGVRSIRRTDLEAIGELSTPASTTDGWKAGVYPPLLDAALQIVGAALPVADAGALQGCYLPMAVDRAEFYGAPAGASFTSRVQIRPIAEPRPETLTADVHMFDGAGTPVVAILGLRLKRVRVEETTPDVADWMYEIEWRAQPLDDGGSSTLETDDLRAAVERAVPALQDQRVFARYDALVPQLDAAAIAWIIRALGTLGWRPHVGSTVSSSALASSLGVVEQHRRLFNRLLAMLAEDGFLLPLGGDQWTVARELAAADPAGDLDALLASYPEYDAELSLIARCGPALAAALRGEADPLELLFPGGDSSIAERLYEQSPIAKGYNALVRAAVTTAARAIASRRRVRILEIGGGTGGTTSGLLAELPADRTTYVFTDISRLFTSRAAEKFREYRFVEYRTLDIERDPRAQGFDGEPFDIILAVNVLHATRDLDETLGHVRDLLAPAGVLIALEMDRPQRDIDLVFGLTDGWWRFTDTIRRPSSLLMSRARWLTLFDEIGFRDGFALPAGGEVTGCAANQAVLVARGAGAATAVAASHRRWIVFEDEHETSPLVAELERGGDTTIRVRRGPAFAATGDREFTVNAARVEDYVQLLTRASASREYGGIVHLWSLDARPETELDATTADDEQALGAMSVLHLVQAIGTTASRVDRVVLVTRGAQLRGDETAARLSQAPLWGMAKVIALEHPELACVRIDLDPTDPAPDTVALVSELRDGGREEQVMYRNRQRFVPRLVRAARRAGQARSEPFRFEVGTRGLLDSIEATPLARRIPDGGEVEVAIAATGLNFRDVLGAMGLYPGDPGPLGGEFAGTVTSVGAGVTHLAVGDEVFGLAPGCLASHVTAPAHFVLRRPASLGIAQAASTIVPYLTAHFALLHVARLRAGERVLIHSASGGVGLAAVHLARLLGAEVYATAGSERKRAYLRSLGIEVVADSRSVDFATVVREATGGQGVGVVLNSLGPEFVRPGLSTLAPGGRFVEIAKTGILSSDQRASLRPDIQYNVVDWSEDARTAPDVVRSMIDAVVHLLSTGRVPPLPVRVFADTEVPAAFRVMANARHIGKIVIERAVSDGAQRLALRADASYLITGGLRGLGLLIAERFVERGARHLILLGRAEPSADAQRTVARLEAAGAQVVTLRCDVSDMNAVAQAVASAARIAPPVAGAVHAAGVLNDGSLQRLDWSRFADVLSPKLRGTCDLYEALRDQPLDFFVLFSSIAAVFGSPGQANHAAANAFLDAAGRYLRAGGVPATSINWGVWAEVGAAAERQVSSRTVNQGIDAIAPELGLDALERAIASRTGQVVISPVRWPAFFGSLRPDAHPAFLRDLLPAVRRAEPAVRSSAAAGVSVRERIAEAPANKRRPILVGFVRETVARVLGAETIEAIDPQMPLTDLGLDSLMAVELRNLLGAGLQYERTLPATLVYDYTSVEAIAGYLAEQLGYERTRSEAAAPVAAPGQADLLDEIEQLSDEEIDRLFAARTTEQS